MVLVEEIYGGHSPMMQLDGTWNVDQHTVTANGQTSNVKNVDDVWFNAKKDIGGYCEGTWYEMSTSTRIFHWNFDKKGDDFTTKESGQHDAKWEVVHQSKDKFVIQRYNSLGALEYMSFSK